jgi:hypothetical protein
MNQKGGLRQNSGSPHWGNVTFTKKIPTMPIMGIYGFECFTSLHRKITLEVEDYG